ncbi:MAG TPA: FtsX-like permease family protein [Rhodanobacteraceae bacterium]
MRHNKAGVVLIALQVALTLAILCNALFLIHQQLHDSHRPSGIADEANLLVVYNDWVGDPSDAQSLQQADLAMLRRLPGVVDASATFSIPLGGGGWGCSVRKAVDQQLASTWCSTYLVDEHARKVLGVRLLAGRWFTPSEYVDRRENDAKAPSSVIIVTRALAAKLFPNGNALGKTIYIDRAAQTIVGIIARLQTPNVSDGEADIEYSVLQPDRYVGHNGYYLIRARPGEINAVAAAAPRALRKLDNARVIRYVRTFPDVRARAYRGARGLAAVLATICAILLAITAFGIVGLTTSWVNRRRREVGIRRALGATRHAILHQFQIENLVITSVACVAGMALAIVLNLWMMDHFETHRIPLLLVISAAIAVLGLGQLAVLWPATRASSIPPALAART